MAETKILTRGELSEMFYEAIPDYFKADGAPCEFSTLVEYFYGDGEYDPNRCASKITSTTTMEDFLMEYVGPYVDVLATPESLYQYTYSLGDGQLIPENEIADPRRRMSGGKFSSVHNYDTRYLTTTLNNGIRINLNFFIGSGTYKRIIYSTSVSLNNIGSSWTNDTYSFITSNNQDIGIELIYTNVASANITELTLSSEYGSNSVSIPLTKLSENNTKSVFTSYIDKIQMDTLLSTDNLRFAIKGNLVGTAQPDVPYTFNLKNCYSLADSSINLTSFYNKSSSQVRLAYTNLGSTNNKIILYGDNWSELWSTTSATLNNFTLTVPNIHETAESYSDSYNYFFLKVPLEFYNSSVGGWTRAVLYYPLISSSQGSQHLQLTNGPLYVGMCNYHTTNGVWKWTLGNSAQYNTTIFLPNAFTAANVSQAGEVRSGYSAQFNELDMPCTHIIHLRATSNYNNLYVRAEGTGNYIRFGTTITRMNIIPNTITSFETLVGYLNQNESENITYELTYNVDY